jgi:hypothetical protein
MDHINQQLATATLNLDYPFAIKATLTVYTLVCIGLLVQGIDLFCACNVLAHDNITATSVDVKWMFSQGRLILSHVRSCLSVEST